MEHVKDNVYRDKSTKILYKINQKYPTYSYFDCFDDECFGRLRFDVRNVKYIMNKHTIDHSVDLMQNELALWKIGKSIIEMAQSEQYHHLDSHQIVDEVMKKFEDVTLPNGYYASAQRSVRNARYRINKKGE